MNPDKLAKGIDVYLEEGTESAVFEFACTYVRRLYADA